MYFNGLSKDDLESYEESCKQNQIRMVTLFGQKVYSAKCESFRSGNEEVNRNCVNPLMNDFDIRLLANHESVGRREIHSIGYSQDTIDLNETPVNEPVSNHHQCSFQDLNLPYTEDTEMSSEKSGLDDFMPICLDDIHEKDSTASPASCCTAENNSRTEQEDVIQIAAECLIQISAVSLNQSQDFPSFSSQDQDLLNKPEMGNDEKPCCSCDSFELHALGISETIPEDVSCVSSKAIYELSNKKEFGVKLRRGRRMKNFQKEILLGLVSLSRHEIREDINILEAVLRSREYKKIQGKTRDGKYRASPRNNKDSPHRYVTRRRRRT